MLGAGAGPKAFAAIAEYADGWMPIMRWDKNPVERIPALREHLERAGRDPKTVPVSIFFAPPKPPALEALAKAGVVRAIFGLPSEPRDAILPRLDAYAAAMRTV